MERTKVLSIEEPQVASVLPTAVQNYLGEVISIKKLPSLFEDSTHAIWRLQTQDDCYALKKCPAHLHQIETAVFWRGVRHLWGVDLPKQLGDFAKIYAFLSKYSGLKVPPLVMAQSSDGIQDGWLLNRWMPGSKITAATPRLITQLANHLASLHSQTRPYFGSLMGEQFPLSTFGHKVLETLESIASTQSSSLKLTNDEVKSLQNWSPLVSVPVMLDLRWDQFLQSEQGDLTTLVDCDAFVWAPRELVLVQVFKLMSNENLKNFNQVYFQETSIHQKV